MALHFNQELQNKYPHLEVSVLKMSEVKINNENLFRLEAEFYKKEYLELEEITRNFDILKNYANKIECGPFGSNLLDTEYKDDGILVVRPFNLKNCCVETENLVYISPEYLIKNSLKIYKKNTLLFSRVGDIKIGVLDREQATISPNIIAVELQNENMANFMAVYFHTKYGFKQIERQLKVAAQPTISTEIIAKLKIPLFPIEFQQQIEQMVRESHECLEQSKGLYREAEVLLYRELGLDPENPLASIEPHSGSLNISVRPLSQSLNATGRLDSEYYQDKYDLMEKQIKKNGFKTLEEICSLINYGSVPTSPYSETDKGVPYIKGLNLKNLQIDETKLDRITNTEDLNSRFFTKENDIVISQMGTVGDVGVVSKEQENYIFASFTIRVRLKNIEEFNPYFVALYIQNIAKEWYLYRNIAQASVRQNTDLPTIKNLYVPLVSYEKQTQIAEKIKQSFTLRKKASELLQTAKQSVETAIEKG